MRTNCRRPALLKSKKIDTVSIKKYFLETQTVSKYLNQ